MFISHTPLPGLLTEGNARTDRALRGQDRCGFRPAAGCKHGKLRGCGVNGKSGKGLQTSNAALVRNYEVSFWKQEASLCALGASCLFQLPRISLAEDILSCQVSYRMFIRSYGK
ncbi:unnamed protein product [Caretta caretta]